MWLEFLITLINIATCNECDCVLFSRFSHFNRLKICCHVIIINNQFSNRYKNDIIKYILYKTQNPLFINGLMKYVEMDYYHPHQMCPFFYMEKN